jgi:hypothetical protein
MGDNSLSGGAPELGISAKELAYIQQRRGFSTPDLWAESANFPAFFPVSRESDPEKGSLQTPTTATQS